MAPLQVVCPSGSHAGDLINVTAPGGQEFEVTVPAGVAEGETFYIQTSQDGGDSSGGDGQPSDVDTFMEQAAPSMDRSSAELLRAVLQALHDDEALDNFVDDHSERFQDYEADGEQLLEWGSLHREYVVLVERCLDGVLARGKGSAEDLYELLEVHRDSARGQRFLDKFLSMGDYHAFCAMMCTWTKLETVKEQSSFIDAEQAAIDEL